MLITLRGNEYLPVLDEWTDDADFTTFVCILGEALARGDHAIDAPPFLLERLAAWEGLSRPQRFALNTMVGQVIRRELPFEQVTDSLVITGPAGPTPDPVGPIRWHRRDWTWLRRNERLDATVLGGEDIDDAEWYVWLGRAWGMRLRSGSLVADDELSLDRRLLGGGSAERVIRHESNWLADMARRGFFARPTLDPDLAFIDIGKEQCERRLLDVGEPAVAYRAAALAKIRHLDPKCTASSATCERTAEEPACTGKLTLPKSCVIVHNVGKPLRDIVATLASEQAAPSHSAAAGSVAAWLATMLPDDDPAVLTPARLVWSWGLRSPPRLLSAP
jgi:hypothetical protein